MALYTFVRPEFPPETLNRYPSLSLALGNHYPKLRAAPTYHVIDSGPWNHTFPPPFDEPSSFLSAPTTMQLEPSIMSAHSKIAAMFQTTATSYAFRDNRFPMNDPPFGNDVSLIYPDPISALSVPQSDVRTSPRANSPSWRTPSLDFISIVPPIAANRKPRLVKPKDLSCVPRANAHNNYANSEAMTESTTCPTKLHSCPYCAKKFTRPCDVTTHKNTHTGARPFRCPVRGCLKKFGVRSNMLRHSILHGIPRTGRVRPVPKYDLEFKHCKCPPVRSDEMESSQIVWDFEGPLSKRPAWCADEK
ncbi:hypothetical protein B0H15DRAFT_26600 [Mycena belliarum]|uniref:C2H2-type domain-containing protein n=1 Tax=Mycena belliarum TaxID=1033014 RepID=A0AAD6UJ61_9AGAR|nr:hypothetical protein B0H15DRAFT_26600 [Mycena belliae]